MRPRDKLKPPTRKARAVTRPSPPLRHDEPASKQLRMIFNERRVVAPAFRGRRFADRHLAPPGIAAIAAEPVADPLPEPRLQTRDHLPVLTWRAGRPVIA